MKVTLPKDFVVRSRRIKWVFTDVDGTLTDGQVSYSPDGEVLKAFSLRDGTGFFLLRACGIKVGIVTGEDSPIVKQRVDKLKVDKLFLGIQNKLETFCKWATEEDLSMDEIAYIGDDLNDFKLMRSCGLSFAVADASDPVKEVADVVLLRKGGEGAFREMANLIVEARGTSQNEIAEKFL